MVLTTCITALKQSPWAVIFFIDYILNKESIMFSPSNTELSPFCIIVLLFFLFEIAVAQMHDKTSHPAKNVMSQINRQGSFGTNELILYDTNYIMIS